MSQWHSNWTTLCGPEGLEIWSPQRHDIGICFQQMFLEIPVLTILAVSSAYYFGKHGRYVAREKIQLYAINFRATVVFVLAILPIFQIYIDINESDTEIPLISYFLRTVQGIAWLTHFIYKIGLRRKLCLSPRGPLSLCVIWSIMFTLTIISLRSHILIKKYSINQSFHIMLSYYFSILYTVAQILYAITLLPSQGSATYLYFADRYTEISETQPLLSNAYSRFIEDGDPTYLGVAMEEANWFSKLLFYWVNPLMEKGTHGQLKTSEDLYDLPVALSSGPIGSKLNKALNDPIHKQQRNRYFGSTEVIFSQHRYNHSLLIALHKCFWLQFYSVGLLKFISDCAGFASPMLLNKLVSFIEDKTEDIKWGYIYAAGLMLTTLVGSLCDAHFNFLMCVVGIKIRGSLVTIIYRKIMAVSQTVLNRAFSHGEIVNFMSLDTDRIVNSCPSFHALWSIPFQLVVTLYLLYTQVGWAFLAGVVFSIILIPINKVIANKIGQLSTKMMEQKDERVKMVMEVLRGIKAVKIYVWEQHFLRLITKLRDEELKYLKGRKYLDALCVYFWATTPILISVLTFGTYVLLGNKLSAATVFTGIALLNMLISPLNAFPWVLNGMAEAWVSIKRIQNLMDLTDFDCDDYYLPVSDNLNGVDITILNGEFSWDKPMSTEEKMQLHAVKKKNALKGKGKVRKPSFRIDDRRSIEGHILEEDTYIFKLSNIYLSVKRGEFIGIIGSVGSGKSSLLSAILGELVFVQGEISTSQLESGFGFVAQQPWLQRGTIRDNILFGKSYDDAKYKSVIFACGLVEDLNCLPSADFTGIGEGGTTLSGGQKARIALARAVYQEKSVYLLDDILSAVDVKVANHIYQHCIIGLLKNCTRLLCTHHVQYLIHADVIIDMENGSVKKQGKPVDVLSNVDDMLPIDLELGESLSSLSSPPSLLDSIQQERSLVQDEGDSVLLLESSETGSLHLSVYSLYWKAIGHLLSLSILLSIIMMQTSRNMTDWWMAEWVTNAGGGGSNHTGLTFRGNGLLASIGADEEPMSYYLKIYVELAVINTFFTLIRAFLFAYGGIMAASKVHKLLLRSVIKAKSAFFDVTPIGRIVNRFSSDTYTVDDSLPFILNILLAQLFSLMGAIIVTVYGLPWICLILVPLIPIYNWLQNNYRLTSRELKRITSVTLSPVYNHFTETLQGLMTIRAMRATSRFKRENEHNIDANLKAQFASQAAVRWLGLRLQFIGVAMVSGVGFIAVIQHQYDVADAGLVGLALSYALSVTGALSGVVNAFTETEREMIAVERVSQYIDEIPTETSHSSVDPPFGWPSQGVICFSNVVLKYRDHLPPSIDGATFETRPSEKIGVVGRTGAGKSSLICALFRLVEISSGSVSIDSINISQVSLSALRSRIFCIPQESFLFSGSIRENLDPLGEFREHDIWNSLTKVNLADTVKRLGGLDKHVEGGGVNFSVGQKQLICLARAVLHNAKILCIDEATANVDQETDRQIQMTIRSAFRKSTVLTIAHRIQTIMDSDRVLVMSEGRIVEFDQPDVLLENPSSHFHQLVNQS